jgi:hypothetical protein
MMNTIRLIIATVVVSVCALFSVTTTATAATVTQCGTSICYTYDNAQSAVADFGLPSIVGDALVFLPPSFRAESTDGFGVHTGTNIDTYTSNFVIDRAASINGDSLISVVVYEEGDYEIANGDRVGADLRLSVVNLTPSNSIFPETGFSHISFDAAGDSGGLQAWNLLGTFDLNSEFNIATDAVGFTIQNSLLAETNANGENAWIQKKVALTTSTVPIPGAVWLFISALGALGWMQRRKSIAQSL